MTRLTRTLIGIVLVSLPITALVLWLAARTQEQLPPNARSEDSTSGLVVLSFAISTVMVLVVNLFESLRARSKESGPPSLD